MTHILHVTLEVVFPPLIATTVKPFMERERSVTRTDLLAKTKSLK